MNDDAREDVSRYVFLNDKTHEYQDPLLANVQRMNHSFPLYDCLVLSFNAIIDDLRKRLDRMLNGG